VCVFVLYIYILWANILCKGREATRNCYNVGEASYNFKHTSLSRFAAFEYCKRFIIEAPSLKMTF